MVKKIYFIIIAVMLLMIGTTGAEVNLSGTWKSTDEKGGTIEINKDLLGIWTRNTTPKYSVIEFKINPIETGYYLFKGNDSEILIGSVSEKAGIILYNLSPEYSDTVPPSLQFKLVNNVSNNTDRGMFLSGFSTGVAASQEEKVSADNAGSEGNERFKEGGAVDCDNEMCTCDGAACSCSGPDCECEGNDCSQTKEGYKCNGWDCWFICKDGKNCKITG